MKTAIQRYFLRTKGNSNMLALFLATTTVLFSGFTETFGVVEAAEPRYNILSIGSQSYYAPLTAKFLDYMEMKAYLIAMNNQCNIGERTHKKIALSEMFDYFTGSETGAIIGAALLVKNDDVTSLN